METTCAYHPDRPSVAECAECGKSICEECREMVADKPVCAACVQQIRERVAASMDARPAAPTAQSAPVQAAYAPPPPTNPAKLIGGIVAGILVGALGAFVWDKFVFYSHIQFGLIASGIGWAVGFAMVIGSGGQGGIVPALIGAALAFCAMIFGQYLLLLDVAASQFHVSIPIGQLPISAVFETMEVMDWVFIAIGVYGGFQVPMAGGKSQSATS